MTIDEVKRQARKELKRSTSVRICRLSTWLLDLIETLETQDEVLLGELNLKDYGRKT